MWKLHDIKFQGPWIKFYWKSAMLTYLCTVCGYFCITIAELNSCHRSYGSQNLKYLLSGSFRKSLMRLHWRRDETFLMALSNGTYVICCLGKNSKLLIDTYN